MTPVSILSNLLTKGVSVSCECVCENPSLSSTECNLWRGYSFVNLPFGKSQIWKNEMKIIGCEVRTSSVWLRYPPPAKCARDPRTVLPPLSARQPASRRRLRLITSQSCKNFAKIYQIDGFVFSFLCLCDLDTRSMENGIFQISSSASQPGPVGTSDINWESLLTG